MRKKLKNNKSNRKNNKDLNERQTEKMNLKKLNNFCSNCKKMAKNKTINMKKKKSQLNNKEILLSRPNFFEFL